MTGSTPTAYLRDRDGVVGRLYGAKTTPHMYVITAEGDSFITEPLTAFVPQILRI